MKNQTEYPKFISNQPCGKDMSFGKSQERVAKAMAEHIRKEEIKTKNKKNGKEEHSLPHIIGLEGDWGSGKSNLIRILKENFLKDTHYVFEYDAWGHQEDLQRRSFLETLTNKLIKEKILPEYTEVIRDKKEVKITWLEKIEDLLARKRRTNYKTNPKLSFAIIISIILLIITPITTSIAKENYLGGLWKTILYLVPIILIVIYAIYIFFSKNNWADLFVVYSGKQIKDVVYETISEKEPSVTEFNKWMDDLSRDLQKKLIVVFDNMDRLPAYKVKELWSSIHTFFAEVSYDNIWVIITFDRNHLANAFGKSESSENEEAKKLTSHFINKTFPVIYRVASTVISDFKLVFNDYFDEAFGKDEIVKKEKDTILRIFGIIKLNPTIRDVIAFINELVSQKIAWKTEISLLHIAIFTLIKDKIINDENSIAVNILSNNYYTDILKLIDDEQKLQESISALAYNIDKDSARQVPMTQYLGILFSDENGTNNISSYSSHRCFMEVLLDVIQDVDTTLNGRTIKKMHELDTTELEDSENRLEEIWNYLTSQEVKQTIDSLKFKEEHIILLIRGSEENRNSIFEYLCKEYQNFKEINGAL
ncbi:MAG: P-loop NTPase fold protein [Ignavibacteria bacterium]|nr:P-loop NTPase fold protein [Ignavibacteria bacterium]